MMCSFTSRFDPPYFSSDSAFGVTGRAILSVASEFTTMSVLVGSFGDLFTHTATVAGPPLCIEAQLWALLYGLKYCQETYLSKKAS